MAEARDTAPAAGAGAAEETRLAELLAAVSLATDLGRGFPQEKTLRTCLVADRLARELGLRDRERRDLLYAALVHAVGCTAFTYEAARTFGTDELRGIPAYAAADPTRPSEAIRALREEVRGEPLPTRVRAVARNLAQGTRFLDYAIRADCEAGRHFTAKVGLGDAVARTVTQVRERWDGKGHPAGLRGEEIALGARIVALADVVEDAHRREGAEAARATVRRRAGGWLDPGVVAAFGRCGEEALAALDAGSVWDAALEAEPAPVVTVPAARVDALAEALADVVDLKSPSFLGHSTGVARLAEEAGARLGLGADGRVALRRAGLLHDLGRVGVPSRVWEKPGPLSPSEWEQVRLHAYAGERILARAPALAPLATLAGMHHERLDGSGYHRGAAAAAIPAAARLLAAADVLHALTEPRPHRPARPPEQAARELESMASAGALDPEAVRAVCEAAGAPRPRRTAAAWPAGLTDREVDVLRLLARGLTKKEAARALVVAPGTVHTHTVHIYEKLGVSTRAGMALFASEHGLLAG